MSALATPAASVAGTGAMPGGAPSPSADLETVVGTQPGGEPGGGESAEPGAGAPPEGQPEAGTEAGAKGTADEGSNEDGRAIPAKWREAFKNDPELKALFFERRAFLKEFPKGIQEIRAMKETLDLAGGEAGLQQMQTDVADFRTLANQFLDGDPAYINDVFETDPVAAASHVPAYLDKFREVDEPGYNREIAKRIQGEHAAWGLRTTLKDVYDAVESDPARAKQLLNSIAAWDDRLKSIGEQEEDPRVKKLQDQIREGRKSEDAKGKEQLNAAYKSETIQGIQKVATRLLDSYLKDKKLSDEDRGSLMEQITMRANAAILKDAEWLKRRDQVLAGGNKAVSVKFVLAKWDKELGIVAPKVARLFGLGGAKPAPTPAAGNGNGAARPPAAQSGFTMINKMPEAKAIDTYRTSRDMITKEHRAILKDGTKVDWSRALAG